MTERERVPVFQFAALVLPQFALKIPGTIPFSENDTNDPKSDHLF
ncbi:MAG: hypothetical protein ACI9JL_003656 [Paracoccaceae bacterium]|jgi:hypothetical protein